MKDIENSSVHIQDTDVVLEEILDKAKPFLKSSLKNWISGQSLLEKTVDNPFDRRLRFFPK